MTTNEVPLKSAAIVNKLLALRPKLNAPQNETHKPITSLRVETSNVTKDVNKFRACDGYTCFYCREWAQLLQRKHFPSASRIRKESILAVAFAQPIPREEVNAFCTTLQQLTQATLSKDTNSDSSILSHVADSVNEWLQKTPSTFETLNRTFSPISFDTSPDNVPLADITNDPTHILNSVATDKFHLTLNEKDFPLLRSITQNIIASQTTPDCFHTRPDDISLADLELSRRSINDILEKVFKECVHDFEKVVDSLWQSTVIFLQEMKQYEEARVQAVGDGCVNRITQFNQKHQDTLVGFNEFWTAVVDNHKKRSKKLFSKTPSSDQVDASFYSFLDHLSTCCTLWYNEFLKSQIVAIRNLIERLSNTCHERINIAREHIRLADKESKVLEEKLNHIPVQLKAFSASVEAGLGRFEKASNKEFKRRIKRLESLSSSTRSWSISHLKTLMTSNDLATLLLPVLEVQMMDTEFCEVIAVENIMKKHESTIEEVTSRREHIWQDFVRGVSIGRYVLGSVLGKLFLREGLRQIEDRVAAHKEKWLLEQIDDEPSDPIENKKKAKKNKKSGPENTSPIDEKVPKFEVNFAQVVATSPVMNVPALVVDIDTETVSNASADSMPHTPIDIKTQINTEESIKTARATLALPEMTNGALTKTVTNTSRQDLDSLGQTDLINLVLALQEENTSLVRTLVVTKGEFTALSSQISTLTQTLHQQEECIKVKEQEFRKSISLKEAEMENACRYVAAMEQRIVLLEREHPINRHENSRPSTPTLVAEISRLAYQPSISNLRHEIDISDDEVYEFNQVSEQRAIQA
ncbi:hypothetical protein K7432_000518 [Basidiobolus ranarum]|uniref:Uncharacterized protein n=1 Tax=Basidiobolus ranarum TaxID=34480 RepID=A0ABR2WB11_9FUNG